MFASKEMRADLIRELRTTHALQSPERKEKASQQEAILSKQRTRDRDLHKVFTSQPLHTSVLDVYPSELHVLAMFASPVRNWSSLMERRKMLQNL